MLLESKGVVALSYNILIKLPTLQTMKSHMCRGYLSKTRSRLYSHVVVLNAPARAAGLLSANVFMQFSTDISDTYDKTYIVGVGSFSLQFWLNATAPL